jgi:protein-disulfide isomerase
VGPLFEGVIDILGKDKVSIVFKHFPLGFHDQAQLAAEASMAAHAQGKFWEFHDVLFQNQKALERSSLENYARQVGLDLDKFKTALDEGVYTERVKEDMAVCQKAGVRGTPTIFVNGRKYEGEREADKMAEILKKEFLK